MTVAVMTVVDINSYTMMMTVAVMTVVDINSYINYQLSLQLPSHTTCLSDSKFIIRMLYKDKY